MSHRACHFVLREKITQDFLCVENKEDAGVPVYIENTQETRDGNTSFIHIFIKYKYRFPYICARSIACHWANLTWAKVVFWFPGPRKAPG